MLEYTFLMFLLIEKPSQLMFSHHPSFYLRETITVSYHEIFFPYSIFHNYQFNLSADVVHYPRRQQGCVLEKEMSLFTRANQNYRKQP